MKKGLVVLMLTALCAALFAGCGQSTKEKNDDADFLETTEVKEEASDLKEKTEEDVKEEEAEKAGEEEGDFSEEVTLGEVKADPVDVSSNLSGLHHVEIEIQDYGTLEVELDADSAPITVTNFIKLAQEGFYDGLTFHRIIDGFMMQGGDPLGNGTGGSKENIKGEFSENGVENNLAHTKGAISMARSQRMDSASSQFFIVQTESRFLDGQYAVFGYVTDGLEIVDKVCADAKPTDSNGTIKKEEQPVIVAVRVID